jgi:hypothetical protein
MLEKKSGSYKTIIWQKIYELGGFGQLFCISGELTETDVQAEILSHSFF